VADAQFLNVLLSHALLDLTREFERGGPVGGEEPNLVLWSNGLSIMDDGTVDQRALPALARVSKRAVIANTKALKRLGWLEGEDDALTLTAAGRRARDEGRSSLAAAESRWADRFGATRVGSLRSALDRLVQKLDLELPRYLAPYGPSDWSLTGGVAVAAKPGPPRIPAHGKDWSPVIRNVGDTVSGLPLSALLSQALVSFIMDYEDRRLGALVTAVHVGGLSHDRPVPLGDVPPVLRIRGNGKSGLERHGVVKVTTETIDGRDTEVVRLTPRGVVIRDSYRPLARGVEDEWLSRYGSVVADLRGSLEALDDDLLPGLADHPWVLHAPLQGFAEVSGP
jgi:hypothetical protein